MPKAKLPLKRFLSGMLRSIIMGNIDLLGDVVAVLSATSGKKYSVHLAIYQVTARFQKGERYAGWMAAGLHYILGNIQTRDIFHNFVSGRYNGSVWG